MFSRINISTSPSDIVGFPFGELTDKRDATFRVEPHRRISLSTIPWWIDLVQRDSALGEPILEGRPHILAEAVYAARNEQALHVEDVLYRRTRVGLESRDGTREAAERVARALGAELDWASETASKEIDQACAARARDDEAIEAV